jgi:D-alanine-D-alanine ligase-like ATP-grasp enzyme
MAMEIRQVPGSRHALHVWGTGFEEGAIRQLEQLTAMPYVFKHVAALCFTGILLTSKGNYGTLILPV